MMRKTVTRASCRVEFDWYIGGSVLKETVAAGASACRTHFVVDSPESEQDIEKMIRLAKRGCFAEQMVQTAVPLTSTFLVNGRDFVIEL
jgi:uncharacterized OsmC-like protein